MPTTQGATDEKNDMITLRRRRWRLVTWPRPSTAWTWNTCFECLIRLSRLLGAPIGGLVHRQYTAGAGGSGAVLQFNGRVRDELFE